MGTVTSSAGSTSPGPAARLESGRVFSGLSSSEAHRRLTEFGPNEIRREHATNALTLLVRQFGSPVIWLLLVATVLSAVLGEWLDAGSPGPVTSFVAVGTAHLLVERWRPIRFLAVRLIGQTWLWERLRRVPPMRFFRPRSRARALWLLS